MGKRFARLASWVAEPMRSASFLNREPTGGIPTKQHPNPGKSGMCAAHASQGKFYDHRSDVPGLDPLIMETDTTATTTTHYIHANNLLATINHEPSPITHWYHFDALGTTRQLTDASATITDHYTLDAWGNELVATGPTPNPFRYIGTFGYYADGESGLMLLGVRYYVSGTGALLTADPRRYGSNWYVYAGNNPVLITDRTGLDWSCFECCVKDLTSGKPFWLSSICYGLCPWLPPGPYTTPICNACKYGGGIAFGAATLFCMWWCNRVDDPPLPPCDGSCSNPCNITSCNSSCPGERSCEMCCGVLGLDGYPLDVCIARCRGKEPPPPPPPEYPYPSPLPGYPYVGGNR